MPETHAPQILLIEDTLSLSALYEGQLKKAGYSVLCADTGKKAQEILKKTSIQVVLLDLQLPDMNGFDLMKFIQGSIPSETPIAVVVITANGSVNVAVEAMQLGAFDFIVKPLSEDKLLTSVRNALEIASIRKDVSTKQDKTPEPASKTGFIGQSLAMQNIYRMIDSVSSSKASIFITGESGTGKEVCAEAIHNSYLGHKKPFVPINCGAIPKDLIESEIFGHLKGAFTGAIQDRDGAASQANGGTLFLDELCEMDINLQTKLLRFLQTGKIQRVGSSKLETVNVRVICATNRDPLREVQEGRLREDLYYRLHVVPIHLPPLRERDYDILEIARHYLELFSQEEHKNFKRFSPEVEQIFLQWSWPGNVRELQNTVRNIVVLHNGETVTKDMLPAMILRGLTTSHTPPAAPTAPPPPTRSHDYSAYQNQPHHQAATPVAHTLPVSMPAPQTNTGQEPTNNDSFTVELGRPLWQIERDIIEQTIKSYQGSIPKAAHALDISPSTIYRKRESWEKKENAS